MLAKLKGWRTVIWNAILVVVGVVGTAFAALNSDQLAAILPEKYRPFAPLILSLIGAIGMGFRWMTTGPVGEGHDHDHDHEGEDKCSPSPH